MLPNIILSAKRVNQIPGLFWAARVHVDPIKGTLKNEYIPYARLQQINFHKS